MSRPKEPRVRRARPQDLKRKGGAKGRGGGQGMPGIWLWAAIGAVVVLAAIGVAALLASGSGEPSPVKAFAIQGTEHISQGESHPPYNSNPPTSGWHYANSAPWGVYDRELPDEQLIHNLEHGGIWISYQPALDGESVEKLREITRRYRSKVILTPRAKNDTKMALAAWGRLDTLDTVEEKRIVAFINSFKDQGPERVPD